MVPGAGMYHASDRISGLFGGLTGPRSGSKLIVKEAHAFQQVGVAVV